MKTPAQTPPAPQPDVAALQTENAELKEQLTAAGLNLPEEIRWRVAAGLPLDKARAVVARQPLFQKLWAEFEVKRKAAREKLATGS